jgi:DNA primase small subunit
MEKEQVSEQARQEFLQRAFANYYSTSPAIKMVSVPTIDSREFGAGFEKKIDFRHKSFVSLAEFLGFLARDGPLYVSYSTARYRYPAAKPMGKKECLGSDLAFDLDTNFSDRPHPTGGHNPIICAHCLNLARDEAARFLDEFLCGDFGFKRSEVSTNFSGSKGFHFHVRTQEVQQLSPDARKQLCDYAAAYEVAAIKDDNKGILREKRDGTAQELWGPKSSDGGWGRKMLTQATNFIASAGDDELKKEGISSQKIRTQILAARQELLNKLAQGDWDYLPGKYVAGGLKDFWIGFVNRAISRIRVQTDAPVTFDRARLIRVPDTLHGDTGLVAQTRQALDGFEPLKSAVAFTSGVGLVTPTVDGTLEIGGQTVEFKAGMEAELPLSAAVMLVAKRKAIPAQNRDRT